MKNKPSYLRIRRKWSRKPVTLVHKSKKIKKRIGGKVKNWDEK